MLVGHLQLVIDRSALAEVIAPETVPVSMVLASVREPGAGPLVIGSPQR
jgi:hypothetical protein